MKRTLCNTAPTTLMTLDEAIQHCVENSEGCTQCAKEHQQLKCWLEELSFLELGIENGILLYLANK